MGYLKKIKELIPQQGPSPVPEPVREEIPERKDARPFKSCDDFVHPDNCDCSGCFILGKKAKKPQLQRQIHKTVSRDGETIYYVIEYKKGSTVFYLVYPSDVEYEAIAQEWRSDQLF